MRSWFEQISAITVKPLKTQVYSRFIISVLGLFVPVMREVKEMLYLYENTILLNDDKVLCRLPRFPAHAHEAGITRNAGLVSEIRGELEGNVSRVL